MESDPSELVQIADRLSRALDRLSFSDPVHYVYNPLSYARAPWVEYARRYGSAPKQAVFLGMNPGPWGMAQTGVPFGEVTLVREWLGIEAEVERPVSEHPKRPVEGFDCARSEVSGRRLWGWASERFGEPARFFDRFFVANYCPLQFLADSGRNLTPDKLRASERDPMLALCDEALRRTVRCLSPQRVIGIGAFAQRRAEVGLAGIDVEIGRILHPSPASPAANRGWAEQAEAQLQSMGLKL